MFEWNKEPQKAMKKESRKNDGEKLQINNNSKKIQNKLSFK